MKKLQEELERSQKLLTVSESKRMDLTEKYVAVGEKIESMLKIEELESERNARTRQKMKNFKQQLKNWRQQSQILESELEKLTKKILKYKSKLEENQRTNVFE